MRYASLWSAAWSTGEVPGADLVAALLGVAPRVVVEGRGVVWADLGGLPGAAAAERLLALAEAWFPDDVVRAGLASVPVVAEVAARGRGDGFAGRLKVVEPGGEAEFLAPLPLSLLASAAHGAGFSRRSGRWSRAGRSPGRDAAAFQRLLALLAGVGLRHCGELAALELADVEVRFGAEGVHLWRLARGDDRRRLFPPIPPERPHASLDFIDYVVTEPERLIFTINSLLESVTSSLRGRGEAARSLSLSFALAGGGIWRRSLRGARPTASREVWLRLARRLLERSPLPDAVAGLAIEAEALEPLAVRQGDLFDPGFATAGALEAALARLLEEQGEIVVAPRRSGHALPERGVAWAPVDPLESLSGPASPGRGGARGEGVDDVDYPGPRLALSLLAEPRPIDVEVGAGRRAGSRGDVPVRYRDHSGWKVIRTALGPDRISGGRWEDEPYAREYFRCMTRDGELVWIFRDARRGGWFLHGWWE